MFIMSFLPDWLLVWAINLVILAGLLGALSSYFIRFIPVLAPQAKVIQVAGIILLVLGVYLRGGYSNEMVWRERVAELEAKIAVAEVESKEQNVKIEKKVVTKIEVVKQRGDDIVKYIDREITKYDNTCVIPKEFVKAHNDAAEAPK
jgi:hypothetical protein